MTSPCGICTADTHGAQLCISCAEAVGRLITIHTIAATLPKPTLPLTLYHEDSAEANILRLRKAVGLDK